MASEVLHSFLKEYEKKKLKAELDLEKRKKALYLKIPRLQEIENELNRFAIVTAKNILSNPSFSIDDLKKKVESLKYEKACLLEKANLPANYLQPNYECNYCHDTGYITSPMHETQMCHCLKQKLLDVSFNKSNMINLEKENFSTFNENLFSDEIDVAKYRFNISPRENIKNIKEKCMDFVKNFDQPDTKNLLFSGNTGLR